MAVEAIPQSNAQQTVNLIVSRDVCLTHVETMNLRLGTRTGTRNRGPRNGVRQSPGVFEGTPGSKVPGDWHTPKFGGDSTVHGELILRSVSCARARAPDSCHCLPVWLEAPSRLCTPPAKADNKNRTC